MFILVNFSPFYPPNNPKNRNFKTNEKTHSVPEIWHMTDLILIFHFELYFYFLLLNSQKNENSKNWKKGLEISSIYTSVPKIIIICYTVLEIWHVKDAIVVFHFGFIFCPFTSPPPPPSLLKQPKKSRFQKNEKKAWRYHHFTHVYQKLWLDDAQFLRYDVRQTDGQRERQIDGQTEKVTYRGGCPT